MTEAKSRARRPDVDWEAVERHYRAGVLSLSQISRDYGVSRPAIEKRATRDGWTRSLSEKIAQTAESKVVQKVAAKEAAGKVAGGASAGCTPATKLTERQTVDAYSDVIARVEVAQRDDLEAAVSVTRAQLQELADLSDPEFRARLEWLGQVMDESGPTESGGWKNDKANELYRYIISLAGRVKMAKEIAGAYGVYIPVQRKVLGLDNERKSTSEYEDLLRRIGESSE